MAGVPAVREEGVGDGQHEGAGGAVRQGRARGGRGDRDGAGGRAVDGKGDWDGEEARFGVRDAQEGGRGG